MRTVSFYHRATGIFTAQQLTADDAMIAANTPLDHVAIDGQFDHLRERVDATGKVVAWRHPSLDRIEAAEARRRLEQRATMLEQRQTRAIRSLLLDPNDEQARAILRSIETEIGALGLRAN
ncbi:MAG: hypothetical protein HS128_23535 [Ideonella sp.]|nr:hypothetical protein [Ideonella sp.]